MPAPTPTGQEHALLLDRHHGLHASEEPGWSYWVRHPQTTHPSLAEYALPDERCIVAAEMRAFTESALGVGFGGDAFPLRLWFRGGPCPERRVIFVPEAGEARLPDGTLLLSYRNARRVAFVAHHRSVRVESRAEAGVVEFRLRALAIASSSSQVLDAYDLVAPAAEARLPF